MQTDPEVFARNVARVQRNARIKVWVKAFAGPFLFFVAIAVIILCLP